MQHAASAITAPDSDQLPVYWQFHAAVARAQLADWLPVSRRLLIDISGPRAHAAELVPSLLLIPNAAPPLLLVAWTLEFEIYFYLVFALLISAISSEAKKLFFFKNFSAICAPTSPWRMRRGASRKPMSCMRAAGATRCMRGNFSPRAIWSARLRTRRTCLISWATSASTSESA